MVDGGKCGHGQVMEGGQTLVDAPSDSSHHDNVKSHLFITGGAVFICAISTLSHVLLYPAQRFHEIGRVLVGHMDNWVVVATYCLKRGSYVRL